MMKFNWPPRLDLDTAIRKAASDFAALPPEKQAEVFRAQRRSFVIAEAGFGSDRQEAEYSQAVADGDADKIALLDKQAEWRMDATRRNLARIGF